MGSVEGERVDAVGDASVAVVMDGRLDFVPRLVKGGDEGGRVDERRVG